jgi:hypothetical protein
MAEDLRVSYSLDRTFARAFALKRMIAIAALLISGCASVPQPPCAKHHCDPTVNEQFKQNASWDARTPGEYAKVPRTN